MSRVRRIAACSSATDAAACVAAWPGPPEMKNTASAAFGAAVAGRTSTASGMRRPARAFRFSNTCTVAQRAPAGESGGQAPPSAMARPASTAIPPNMAYSAASFLFASG